jgi:hypothetical protein
MEFLLEYQRIDSMKLGTVLKQSFFLSFIQRTMHYCSNIWLAISPGLKKSVVILIKCSVAVRIVSFDLNCKMT